MFVLQVNIYTDYFVALLLSNWHEQQQQQGDQGLVVIENRYHQTITALF